MQTVDFRHFRLEKGDKVLDLGCGEGRHVISAYVEGDVQAIGIDLNLDDLKTTHEKFKPFEEKENPRKHFALMSANALQLPFADQTFDKIICSEVLEHIHDYEGVLQEIERVLKPGGLFCASVPRFWPEWVCWHYSDDYHDMPGGHVRIFLEKQLRRKIEQRGFRFYHKHWAHALHTPYWWMQCMDWHNKENNVFVKSYHKMLVWDIMEKPWITRMAEKTLNPVIGKSVVMYFTKEAA
jgi:ubiquinone/menaquinone biosynthesis C-methylase UbiE